LIYKVKFVFICISQENCFVSRSETNKLTYVEGQRGLTHVGVQRNIMYRTKVNLR